MLLIKRIKNYTMCNALEQKLSSIDFPWFFYEKTLGPTIQQPSGWAQNSQFVHVFWNNQPCSQYVSLLHELFKALPIKIDSILKVKANLKLKQEACGLEYPHVDFENATENMYSIIYYVNNSDGDTILYESDNKTIRHKIAPCKGQVLIFKTKQLHSAGYPTKTNKRLVININVIGKLI